MPALGNDPISIPPDCPQPNVPTAIPILRVEKMLEGKYARRVLSKEEFDLFCHTWVEWMTAHPEWNLPEDRDDVIQICMETALQHRLMLLGHDKPGVDITSAYNASTKRKQVARENLTARRVDRTGTKAGANAGKTTINVAVLAGEISPEESARRRQRLLDDSDGEREFLNATVVRPQVTLDTPTEDEE